jgi:hypothetical protein
MDDIVARECIVLTAYLIGRSADRHATVVSRYVAAHRIPKLGLEGDGRNDALVALARRSPGAARLADAYARIFEPTGVLRRKLVLLLAILETSAPSHLLITQPPSQSLPLALLGLGATGLTGIAATLASVPVVALWKLLRPRQVP